MCLAQGSQHSDAGEAQICGPSVYKMLVRIANREDLDQTASEEAV